MSGLTLIALTCLAESNSGTASVWLTSYKAAVAEVKRVDKPLFIFFNNPETSALEVQSGRPVFGEEIDKSLASDYVTMYVDATTQRGELLAAEFKVNTTPAIAILDRTSDWIMYRKSGEISADDLLAIVTRFRGVKYSPPPSDPQTPANSTTKSSAGTKTATPWWCST